MKLIGRGISRRSELRDGRWMGRATRSWILRKPRVTITVKLTHSRAPCDKINSRPKRLRRPVIQRRSAARTTSRQHRGPAAAAAGGSGGVLVVVPTVERIVPDVADPGRRPAGAAEHDRRDGLGDGAPGPAGGVVQDARGAVPAVPLRRLHDRQRHGQRRPARRLREPARRRPLGRPRGAPVPRRPRHGPRDPPEPEQHDPRPARLGPLGPPHLLPAAVRPPEHLRPAQAEGRHLLRRLRHRVDRGGYRYAAD